MIYDLEHTKLSYKGDLNLFVDCVGITHLACRKARIKISPNKHGQHRGMSTLCHISHIQNLSAIFRKCSIPVSNKFIDYIKGKAIHLALDMLFGPIHLVAEVHTVCKNCMCLEQC